MRSGIKAYLGEFSHKGSQADLVPKAKEYSIWIKTFNPFGLTQYYI
jgi:hypothetical protein